MNTKKNKSNENLECNIIGMSPSFAMATQFLANSHASSISAYNAVSNQYQSSMTMNASNVVNLINMYVKCR